MFWEKLDFERLILLQAFYTKSPWNVVIRQSLKRITAPSKHWLTLKTPDDLNLVVRPMSLGKFNIWYFCLEGICYHFN